MSGSIVSRMALAAFAMLFTACQPPSPVTETPPSETSRVSEPRSIEAPEHLVDLTHPIVSYGYK